jgi:hypothetical protein
MQLYKMNAVEQQMAEDLDWAMTAPEVLQHSGMFVIIHRKRVVAVGVDRNSLVKEAAEKAQCPWEDLVVFVVPPTEEFEITD